MKPTLSEPDRKRRETLYSVSALKADYNRKEIAYAETICKAI